MKNPRKFNDYTTDFDDVSVWGTDGIQYHLAANLFVSNGSISLRGGEAGRFVFNTVCRSWECRTLSGPPKCRQQPERYASFFLNFLVFYKKLLTKYFPLYVINQNGGSYDRTDKI
jgi:hypothetical protein